MANRGIPEIGVNPQAPDFVKLAEAFGCPGSMFKIETRLFKPLRMPSNIKVLQ